jgi:NAD(P)-dependent dehydrogenase (short-subunit alcohol dehydrogenase family)
MKHVFITRAAGDFGLPVTHEFARRGYQVFVLDVNIDALEHLGGANIIITQADVTDSDSLMEARDTVFAVKGELDAIINFAGFFAMHPLVEINPTLVE